MNAKPKLRNKCKTENGLRAIFSYESISETKVVAG